MVQSGKSQIAKLEESGERREIEDGSRRISGTENERHLLHS